MDLWNRSEGSLAIALGDLDVTALATSLRDTETFPMQRQRVLTLMRSEDFTVMLMVLGPGIHVRAHCMEHPTTLLALRGRLRVGLTAHTVEVEQQHMLSLPEGTLCDMEAMQDSDVLVVMGR